MHTPDENVTRSNSAPATPELPRPPSPSKDAGIIPVSGLSQADSDTIPNLEDLDIFTLSAIAALKLLCGTIEGLVRITGDVPPTPPISLPSTPNLGLIQTEKESVARQNRRRSSGAVDNADDADGVPPRAKTPIGSPEAHPTEPLHIIGSNMEPLNIQHGAITRKFYSKKPPPIALEEYLMRLHKYCPMSTAVYLATSLYIHRLAVIEKIIPVTARNVHRLVLAGLRVAMKALEDLSYPHRRFAKVGGVSEPELGRLEVSFCFLTNFELKVDKEMLLEHAKVIRDGPFMYGLSAKFQPKMPPTRDKRTIVIGQPRPAVIMETKAPAPA
jgi:hypothetical protein